MWHHLWVSCRVSRRTNQMQIFLFTCDFRIMSLSLSHTLLLISPISCGEEFGLLFISHFLTLTPRLLLPSYRIWFPPSQTYFSNRPIQSNQNVRNGEQLKHFISLLDVKRLYQPHKTLFVAFLTLQVIIIIAPTNKTNTFRTSQNVL